MEDFVITFVISHALAVVLGICIVRIWQIITE